MPNNIQSTPTRFESNPAVQQHFIDSILNNVDDCLARRVAMGIGGTLPAAVNGPSNSTNASTTLPSFYRLTSFLNSNKRNAGLIVADDVRLSASYLASVLTILSAQKASYEVISTHISPLATSVYHNQSFIYTPSTFYDAIFIGGVVSNAGNSSVNASSNLLTLFTVEQFSQEADGHGKANAAIGTGLQALQAVGMRK